MALSYSAYAIATLASTFLVLAGEPVMLHWQQTLVYSQLKCVRCSTHLVPPYHLLLLFIFLTLSC